MRSGQKKPNIKLFWLSAFVVSAVFLVYRVVLMLAENGQIPSIWFTLMMWALMLIGCGVFISVIILQRGFSSKPLLPDELPDSMNAAEKLAYLEDDRRRKKIAKNLMIPLIAIIFVFMFEIIELFYIPAIQSWFSSI